MRLVCLAALTVAALAAPARAGESSRMQFAIGVNPPLLWKFARVGISAYAGITDHQAIRANFATYDYEGPIGDFPLVIEGDVLYMGRITDAGIAWMYFPRGVWSGPLLEAGLLRRGRDTYGWNEYNDPQVAVTNTATYAGRAHVGWSWLFVDHVFISVAAGLSVGYETGREATGTVETPHEMYVTSHVGRMDVSGEFFLRIGGAFGI